ncbi:MAG: hypothetical protein CL666_10190 [Balneola sp.]|nr:hypothetical protein [Balneola sp.]|tara:strand:- start:27844 stop:28071 length:228 start_codon:yes stop_codon:yes gene_type:complete
MNKEKIQEKALKLPEKERAELAQMLLESLPVENKYETEEAWAKELKRRVDQFDSGEGEMTSWEEVSKKARSIIEE